MRENLEKNFSFQKIICCVAIGVFIIRFIAWYMTRSVIILSDALEGLVNVASGFISLYSLYIAKIPKDKNHPYGHGKVEFISAAIEGLLIIIASLAIIVESCFHAIYHIDDSIEKLGYGIGLLLLTVLLNYSIGYLAYKRGKRHQSISLMASGRHLQTDSYSTLGLILGLLVVKLTSWKWLDVSIAIGFSLLILSVGVKLLRGALAGIMDEYDEKLIKELLSYLERYKKKEWIDLHNLRIIKYGSLLHLDCHLRLPWFLNVREAHDQIKDFEELVKKKFKDRIELFVHLNSCNKNFCSSCLNTKCTIREKKFEKLITWNLGNVCKVK